MFEHYGTLQEANTYFDNRLHEQAWYDSPASDRPKALIKASQIIDNLNYKGEKAAVVEILYDEDWNEVDVTDEELRDANLSQPLEFPRGEDTEVPDEIMIACWEVAYALLDGVDPDLDVENLGVSSQGYASIRTTYARSQALVEHLMHGIPSATAWRYLMPFLRDADKIKLSRVD